MTQVTDALAAHLAAFQKNRVYPDAEQERKQLSSEIELFFQERKSTLIMSEGERTKLREDLQNAKDQLASMTKIREDAAFQIRNLEARVLGFQHELAVSRKDKLEMMRRVLAEMELRERRISALEPKADAYDNISVLLGLLRRNTAGAISPDVTHTLRREIENLEVEIAKEGNRAKVEGKTNG